MKIIIKEEQFHRLYLKEDSESGETVVALDHLKTSDKWIEDLDGKYIRRYRKNNIEDVKRIQKMLTLLGYDVGHYGDGEPVIDGIYGPDSAEAIREFQKDKFVEPIEWDEIVGPKTYTKLYEDVEELAHDHLMSVEELLELGLDDDNIMGDEDDPHYDDEDDEDGEEDGGQDNEEDEEEDIYVEENWFAPISEEGSGWEIRYHDHFGSGKYGASRGTRTHKGLDIKSNKGENVFSPMDGKITRTFHPYSDKCRFLKGVEIVGEGEYSDYKMKLMYVDLDNNVDTGDTVKRGDIVATQQDLLECYPPRNGKSMTNHIHFEVYENGRNIDPEKIIDMKRPMIV